MNYVALEYRIIRQGLKNWSTLVGYHAGTARSATGTTRSPAAAASTVQHHPSRPGRGAPQRAVADRYGYGKPPAEGEEKYLFAPMTLKDWCLRQASEDRAAIWLGSGADGAGEAQGGWDPPRRPRRPPTRCRRSGTQFAEQPAWPARRQTLSVRPLTRSPAGRRL